MDISPKEYAVSARQHRRKPVYGEKSIGHPPFFRVLDGGYVRGKSTHIIRSDEPERAHKTLISPDEVGGKRMESCFVRSHLPSNWQKRNRTAKHELKLRWQNAYIDPDLTSEEF